jgi:hypothetical protein
MLFSSHGLIEDRLFGKHSFEESNFIIGTAPVLWHIGAIRSVGSLANLNGIPR